ncbi:MAG: DUF1801 domain-containing protein [Phaeodactylibacter sp.]|nr:DUF1801 domain-containing protein [Phaeodactylibacter sp.]
MENNPIDTYIADFPKEVQAVLEQIRALIREEIPEAKEVMSYQIPTFKLKRNVVHFAAFKSHIGFYPGASGVKAFEDQLGDYVHAKGSIQFPLDQPMPVDLIRAIVQFRVAEEKQKK